jgi:hypothetical protein
VPSDQVKVQGSTRPARSRRQTRLAGCGF